MVDFAKNRWLMVEYDLHHRAFGYLGVFPLHIMKIWLQNLSPLFLQSAVRMSERIPCVLVPKISYPGDIWNLIAFGDSNSCVSRTQTVDWDSVSGESESLD